MPTKKAERTLSDHRVVGQASGDGAPDLSSVPVVEQPSAKAHITAAIRPLMEPLRAITVSRAAEVGIDLRKIEWTAFTFRDRKRTDLVFRVEVNATPSQAMAFWDFLGEALEAWSRHLPPSSARVLEDRTPWKWSGRLGIVVAFDPREFLKSPTSPWRPRRRVAEPVPQSQETRCRVPDDGRSFRGAR